MRFLLSVILYFSVIQLSAQTLSNHQLWYRQPAEHWESEALPIGNGRLGAMFYAGINLDRVQFNEQSLWSGDNNWDGDYETGDRGFGSYRNFGTFEVQFSHQSKASSYRRELDLNTGIHRTSFVVNGNRITREAFASYPDQLMVFRYESSQKAALAGHLSLSSAQGAATTATPGELSFSGSMLNALKYAARLKVVCQGGTLTIDGDRLSFKNCNKLTLYLDARTNYMPDYRAGWRGTDPAPKILKTFKAAQPFSYDQ